MEEASCLGIPKLDLTYEESCLFSVDYFYQHPRFLMNVILISQSSLVSPYKFYMWATILIIAYGSSPCHDFFMESITGIFTHVILC